MTFEEKYKILGSKKSTYDGVFFTGVKTTGIFCHPSCRARTPKVENVIFYNSINECLENGYRPCKICKPLEQIGELPQYIKEILTELKENPHIKISDADLKKRNIEPHTIRRWFKKHYEITFQAYQRMLRINCAFENIKKGTSVTASAFDSGYESLSGFNESYRALFGASVTNSKSKSVINVVRFASPIGSMIACATPKGICYLGFIGQKRMEEHFSELQKEVNAVILPGKNEHLTKVQTELKAYFKGELKKFSVSLDPRGTAFRKEVWFALEQIDYGKVVSYKEQALAMNKLKAIRAIAASNGANKISIIIPCHRVVGSDGSLTGYAGGLHRKKWLLEFEKKNSNQPIQKELKFDD